MSKKSSTANAAIALNTLALLRGGAVLDELAEKVAEATAQTRLTKKPSTVTLTLKIAPADKEAQDVERVWVTDTIAVKLPARPKKDTMLFVDANDNLTEKDPQLSFVVGARTPTPDEKVEARVVGKDAAAGEARALAS
jgi:hypothetical protein